MSIFYVLNDKSSPHRLRKVYPKHVAAKIRVSADPIEWVFDVTKWQGTTLAWNKPSHLIRHPKDLTRAQRRGHAVFERGTTPAQILVHLDTLPLNAPCPYIVRLNTASEEDLAARIFVQGQNWFESAEFNTHSTMGYVSNLRYYMGKFLNSAINKAGAWRSQWFSWDLPRQVNKSPGYIFSFVHRTHKDTLFNLQQKVSAKTHEHMRDTLRLRGG